MTCPITALPIHGGQFSRRLQAINKSRTRRGEYYREMKLALISLDDSLEDAKCAMSIKFENTSESELPALVVKAKQDILALKERLQVQWAGHAAIRERQRAERRVYFRQKRALHPKQ